MDGVLDGYAIAFGSPPWNESAERLASYRTRAIEGTTRADFTLAVARNDDGRVVGFATAWTSPDPFTTGRLYDTIAATLDPPVLRDRLARGVPCGLTRSVVAVGGLLKSTRTGAAAGSMSALAIWTSSVPFRDLVVVSPVSGTVDNQFLL